MKKLSVGKKLPYVYIAFALLLGAALSVWRILIMNRFFDFFSGSYLTSSSGTLTAFGLVVFAVIIILASSALLFRKRGFSEFSSSGTLFSVFSCSFCGFMFVASAILTLAFFSGDVFSPGSSQSGFYKVSAIVSFLLLLLSAVYFISSVSPKGKGSSSRLLFSFFPSAWAMIYMATSYFNYAYTYNDPNRIICNFTLASAALLFLFEARLSVGRNIPYLRFYAALVSVVMIITYIVPQLSFIIAGKINVSCSDVLELPLVGILLYSLWVLFSSASAFSAGETGDAEDTKDAGNAEDAEDAEDSLF